MELMVLMDIFVLENCLRAHCYSNRQIFGLKRAKNQSVFVAVEQVILVLSLFFKSWKTTIQEGFVA
jgi:hypothetical protein